MTLGIAVLGGGIFAKEAHLPALKEVPEFSLKAVWSRSKSSAASVQEAASKLSFPSSSEIEVYSEDSSQILDDLLARSDISVAVLSLTIPAQPEVIKKCWKAGKHVISEKPVAKDVQAGLQLIELWEKEYRPKGVQWIIAEQYPYEKAYAHAREVLESGAIGELRSFDMQWIHWVPADGKYAQTEWRKVPEYQGGFLLDGGVHFVAALRWALAGLGYQISSVSATSSQQQAHLPPVDTMQAIVRLSSLSSSSGEAVKPSGTFTVSVGHEFPTLPFYSFKGSTAELKIQLDPPNPPKGKGMGYNVHLFGERGKVLSQEYFPSEGVKEEMKAFGKALAGDKEMMKVVEAKSGPRAALKDVAVIESALNSAEQDKWVKIGA